MRILHNEDGTRTLIIDSGIDMDSLCQTEEAIIVSLISLAKDNYLLRDEILNFSKGDTIIIEIKETTIVEPYFLCIFCFETKKTENKIPLGKFAICQKI